MTKKLTVDDSASMSQMVTFTLKSAGFDVTGALDGEEALRIAKGQPFDVVITDVNMPNIDDIAFSRELRTLPNFKFTPILILTTESSVDKKKLEEPPEQLDGSLNHLTPISC
jgi:two-component system chemotaxis response regulator CheY